MPYRVGEKGSYGCDGYPVVKEDDNTVMGCHATRSKAEAQITAINISEAKKAAGYQIKQGYGECKGYALVDPDGKTIGCYDTRKQAELAASGAGEDKDDVTTDSANRVVSEGAKMLKASIEEGDFVMGMTSEGIAHGRVEHIMWEGGTLGQPGTEYALESKPPENPAMSVRVYEQEESGKWEATAYSIGMMYQDAKKLESLEGHTMPEEMDDDMVEVSKAEGYAPTSGMKAAARRAIKWKEDGKAKGAGTAVGWGRARDIVAGRSMSLSVVKRMYSFFSRHEVDKKGKGFYDGPDFPSKGRVMWDAWGGDAGYSWSRKIAERAADKALFADFGKDFTRAEPVTEIFKADSVRVGQMVSWNSSGGRARGKVKRVLRSGSYKVPGTDVTINGTEDDPAVVITLYRDGEATDTIVAHRMSTLSAS